MFAQVCTVTVFVSVCVCVCVTECVYVLICQCEFITFGIPLPFLILYTNGILEEGPQTERDRDRVKLGK